MDDASPIAAKDSILEAAVKKLDADGGFATLVYKDREIILMTAEKFEEWEDAVDLAAIERSIANPDPNPISLEDLAAELDIVLPSQRTA